MTCGGISGLVMMAWMGKGVTFMSLCCTRLVLSWGIIEIESLVLNLNRF